MAILYRVADWDDLFENAGSRKVGNLRWVPIPNKHDSDGYTQLVDHPNGAAHYGCWVAIVQVASKCQPRGSLLGGKWEPYGSEVLARKTRMPQTMFEEVLPRLVKLGWLTTETIDTPEDRTSDAPLKPPIIEATDSEMVDGYQPTGSELVAEGKGREGKGIEGKGIEGKGIEGKGTTNTPDKPAKWSGEVGEVWDHYKTHRPRVRVLGKKTLSKIRARLQEGFTAEDLKAAVDGNFRSPHHCGQNPNQTEYHDLELIVRDDEHVRMFIEHAEASGKPILSERSQRTAAALKSYLERTERTEGN